MSYYLYIKTRCDGRCANLFGEFSVEYRTSLPISESDAGTFASRVAALHSESENAETTFEIHNGDDRFQMLYGTMNSNDRKIIGVYGRMSRPYIRTNPQAMRDTAFKVASRCIMAANDVTSGKLPNINLLNLEKEA